MNTVDTPHLQDFVDSFNVQAIGKYLIGSKFDLRAYVHDVHIHKTQKFPKGTTPIFGNLYLAGNREQIATRLKYRRQGQHRYGKFSTSMVWLMPEYPLWGRGDSLVDAVNMFSGILQDGDSSDDLYLVSYAESGEQQKITYDYKISGLKELHFINPLPPDGRLMGGSLELLLYPTAFVFAMFHLPIPGNKDLWAPFGFVSTLPKHLDVAHKLIRKSLAGDKYLGRAQFSPTDRRPSPTSSDEGLPFLNYDSLLLHHSDVYDEDEDSQGEGVHKY